MATRSFRLAAIEPHREPLLGRGKLQVIAHRAGFFPDVRGNGLAWDIMAREIRDDLHRREGAHDLRTNTAQMFRFRRTDALQSDPSRRVFPFVDARGVA